MPPDNIEFVGRQTKIPAGVFRRLTGMRGSVPVGGQPLCLDILELVVVQEGAPGKFPLVDIPAQLLGKPEACLGDLDAVA